MDHEALTDRELLEHTATEPEAFGAFYRRHLPAVVRKRVSRGLAALRAGLEGVG